MARKPKTIGKLIKDADLVFSHYIRRRDAIEYHDKYETPYEYAQCCTCKRVSKWIELQAGHFVPKQGHNATRYREDNVHAQCGGCNCNDGEPALYAIFMNEHYDERKKYELADASAEKHRFIETELRELIDHYKLLVAEQIKVMGG
jgi:5-methylcytosine-specific restriction endonuclease McrA